MEVTQKAIILDRYKNDDGQRVCYSGGNFKCVFYDEDWNSCYILGVELFCYDGIPAEIKPCENCPLWGED